MREDTKTALPHATNRTKEGRENRQYPHTGRGTHHGPRPSPCSSGMQAVHRGKTSPSSAAQLPVDAALNAHSLTLLIFLVQGLFPLPPALPGRTSGGPSRARHTCIILPSKARRKTPG